MIKIKYKNTNFFMKHVVPNMASTIWKTIWFPSKEYEQANPEVVVHEMQHVADMSVWWIISYLLWPWSKAKWETRGYMAALWWLKNNKPEVNIQQTADHYVKTYFGWGPYLYMPLPKKLWEEGLTKIERGESPV